MIQRIETLLLVLVGHPHAKVGTGAKSYVCWWCGMYQTNIQVRQASVFIDLGHGYVFGMSEGVIVFVT